MFISEDTITNENNESEETLAIETLMGCIKWFFYIPVLFIYLFLIGVQLYFTITRGGLLVKFGDLMSMLFYIVTIFSLTIIFFTNDYIAADRARKIMYVSMFIGIFFQLFASIQYYGVSQTIELFIRLLQWIQSKVNEGNIPTFPTPQKPFDGQRAMIILKSTKVF